jgi:hypothetical protein
MSNSFVPATMMLWLSWPTEEATAPFFRPKPLSSPCATLPGRFAVPLDDGDEAEVVTVEMRLPAVGGFERHSHVAERDAGKLGADRMGGDRVGGKVGCQL